MKKLTKKQKEARIEWFGKWLSSVDDRISQWKQTLPIELVEKLDLSPTSLLVLESYLVETYQSPSLAYQKGNADIFDAIATYVGEVFRLHLTLPNIWLPNEYIADKQREEERFVFYPLVGLEGGSGGMNPHLELLPALHFRTGHEIYNFFESVQKRQISENEKFGTDKRPVYPGRGGYSYQVFLLPINENLTLKDLEKLLKNYFQARKKDVEISYFDDSRLIVKIDNGYYFNFKMNSENWVSTELKEMACGFDGNEKVKDIISQCNTRIEFWADEDIEMDFFNAHFSLMEYLAGREEVIVFDHLENNVW